MLKITIRRAEIEIVLKLKRLGLKLNFLSVAEVESSLLLLRVDSILLKHQWGNKNEELSLKSCPLTSGVLYLELICGYSCHI